MAAAGRPAPNTFEFIETIALREPHRLALVQGDMRWSYQALYRDLLRAIGVLRDLGVAPGQRVAVGTSGLQAGLLLLIAAENLGAVTTSFLAQDDPDARALFGLVDWVFSDAPQDVPAPVRFVLLDRGFVARIAQADTAGSVPRIALPLHEPQRISRTSGSSGRSKFMLLARQAQEHWVRSGADNGGYRPETRLLVAGPLVMNAVFARSSACLRMGAAVFSIPHATVAASEITHVLALPALLEEILGAMPPGHVSRRPVQVGTVGGFVSPRLRERAARVFGGHVASRYGANEVTGICEDLDASGCGVVSAGVDLRIVDEAGQELPQGQLGIIAVRTPGMASGYLGEPEASAAAFRDGWFYSGDWGSLVAPRVLRLAGRHDDLIVAGGLKIAAAAVEAQVREITGADDCAVLAVNLDGGETTLGIALVARDVPDRELVRRRLGAGLELGATTGARVIFLDQLPRMGNAKLDRVRLHRLFESPPPGSL
ncbi:hypothetical protein GCM10027034_11650 [Ramlibacter solisilvae]|uniref:AMP-dependent synthetase/ligase domain-containing protein n=1 Tax=Ramlibacter tataouinensis TaxID=94132 RepID=A0A127JXD7_9BURK|nr:class I adenylate-forming enzyme family protein [Ramlibacter tataouinensis]AMO24549.1 hypothetical protein UC35_19005 [Ramlibacter tataouinensis]